MSDWKDEVEVLEKRLESALRRIESLEGNRLLACEKCRVIGKPPDMKIVKLPNRYNIPEGTFCNTCFVRLHDEAKHSIPFVRYGRDKFKDKK